MNSYSTIKSGSNILSLPGLFVFAFFFFFFFSSSVFVPQKRISIKKTKLNGNFKWQNIYFCFSSQKFYLYGFSGLKLFTNFWIVMLIMAKQNLWAAFFFYFIFFKAKPSLFLPFYFIFFFIFLFYFFSSIPRQIFTE